MQMIEILVVTMAFGIGLGVLRFAMLAFAPEHPMAQFMAQLDRLGGRRN